IDRIVLFGQRSDELSVANNVVVDAVLHAGAGDSILVGGGGKNILLGGAGNDILLAGRGRDVLIGGGGSDLLYGGSGDDLLVAGTTDYDTNDAALYALMREWSRTDADYGTRVAHLTGASLGGANGATVLNSSTVHGDGAIDFLLGGSGKDLYFAGLLD